jgi:hypothetical protein
MALTTLDPRTALLVIDPQNAILSHPVIELLGHATPTTDAA